MSAEAASPSQMLVLLGLGASGEVRLLSSITRKSWDALSLHPGQTLFAQIKCVAMADR